MTLIEIPAIRPFARRFLNRPILTVLRPPLTHIAGNRRRRGGAAPRMAVYVNTWSGRYYGEDRPPGLLFMPKEGAIFQRDLRCHNQWNDY
jgi:hypothetical protein